MKVKVLAGNPITITLRDLSPGKIFFLPGSKTPYIRVATSALDLCNGSCFVLDPQTGCLSKVWSGKQVIEDKTAVLTVTYRE